MSKELSAQEYADTIEELDRRGIHYDKTKDEDVYFKCDSNPYLPVPNHETRELFKRIGNIWTYFGSTKTLVIKNTSYKLVM